MQTTIFYHSNCVDGSAAALAAWLALGETARYIPLAYESPLPDDLEPGSDVYFLDVTLKRQAMLAAAQIAGRITVIDHHKSALADLANLPQEADIIMGACEIRTIFDLDHSGAVLAWKHFHPDTTPPFLFYLVEDRDLWRLDLADSKPLHYALESLGNFRAMAEATAHATRLHDLIFEGRVILPHLQHQWDQIASRAAQITTDAWGTDNPVLASYANCPPMWSSDVGHLLLENNAPRLAVLYHDTQATQRRTYSLRSAEDGPDCAVLAAHFGGGGHARAAGFTLPLAGPQPFADQADQADRQDREDAALFRAWISEAEQRPGAVASALSRCMSAEDYRRAISQFRADIQEAA